MPHKTYDVLAVYTVADKRRKPLTRWIAAVSTEDRDPTTEPFYTKAVNTMPKDAVSLSMMVTLPRDADGYAETMKKVNYWAGHPGCPA